MADEATTPDLAERWREAFEVSGNQRNLDAVTSFYAADAVWEVVGLGISLEGLVAIRGFMDDWMGAYEEFEIDVEEILDLGNGVTFGVFIQEGRPTGSKGRVRYRFAQVNTWIDGMIVQSTGYNDIDEARAAAECLAQERG
ncbi:MAG TPA: nuclear transport factor 2 family protein [Solirubrobacteraceae bacterium]|nr:nuclear transport factor 2 family protein [Solirubrobacteraceae bacterium]